MYSTFLSFGNKHADLYNQHKWLRNNLIFTNKKQLRIIYSKTFMVLGRLYFNVV
jgi:hypothetical protein